MDSKTSFNYNKEIWPDLFLINWRLVNDIFNDKLQWSENDEYPMITWNSKPNVNSSVEKIVQNGNYYEGELWIYYRII